MRITFNLLKPAYLGFAAGLLTCIYFFLFYWIDKKQFFNPNIYWGSFSILFLAFGLFIHFERRNAISFPFISGLRGLFFIFFLNSAFYNFFYYLMINYFDSQLIDIQFDVIQDGLNSNSVLSSSEQQSAWKISKEELYSHVKAKTILFSYVQGLPAGFLLSMLFAYIFKKD
jgi:hypothetical protein